MAPDSTIRQMRPVDRGLARGEAQANVNEDRTRDITRPADGQRAKRPKGSSSGDGRVGLAHSVTTISSRHHHRPISSRHHHSRPREWANRVILNGSHEISDEGDDLCSHLGRHQNMDIICIRQYRDTVANERCNGEEDRVHPDGKQLSAQRVTPGESRTARESPPEWLTHARARKARSAARTWK